MRFAFRFAQIGWVVLMAFLTYGWRRLRSGRLGSDARDALRGDVLAKALETLGATYVKFGQILSTRPDILGPQYVAALSRLQDRVPPISFEAVEQVLTLELDSTTRAQLVQICQIPVAAASVAQVHEAWLASGEKIALKVQRPLAREQVERDLVLIRFWARVLNRIPSIRPPVSARRGRALWLRDAWSARFSARGGEQSALCRQLRRHCRYRRAQALRRVLYRTGLGDGVRGGCPGQ